MNRSIEIPLPNLMATNNLARQIAGELESVHGKRPLTLAITGQLGVGKTQWIRYLCEKLGVQPDAVTSPTYVLVQRHRARLGDIYHIDYYRLQHTWQVWDLGIDELQVQPVLILIEWADKFPESLPPNHLRMDFEIQPNQRRTVRLSATGPIAESMLDSIQRSSQSIEETI